MTSSSLEPGAGSADASSPAPTSDADAAAATADAQAPAVISGQADAGDGTRCGLLRARVRDFKIEHPDFEGVVNGRVVPGIVQQQLGPDDKPALNPSVASSNGVTRFEDWYADLPGVNQPFDIDIPLVGAGDGRFVFDSDAFFPIDDRGFGHEYQSHNFHFTTEIHMRFTYRSGDRFTFSGDDDVWLFINGQLAIDLGGVHARQEQTVDLDMQASALGIMPGGSYAMDIFHAERKTASSNFRIETTIACIQSEVLL